MLHVDTTRSLDGVSGFSDVLSNFRKVQVHIRHEKGADMDSKLLASREQEHCLFGVVATRQTIDIRREYADAFAWFFLNGVA